MLKIHQIQITKVDNGFYITSTSDERGKSQKLIATDAEDAKAKLAQVAESVFAPATPAK